MVLPIACLANNVHELAVAKLIIMVIVEVAIRILGVRIIVLPDQILGKGVL